MRPTALIAEDEPALGKWLALQLKRYWPELDVIGVALTGNEALALLSLHDPDIAFLDIRLPEKNGLEIAALDGGHRHIVFVTAHDEYAIQAFDEGAVDYLLKPVEESRLKRCIERLKERLHLAPVNHKNIIDRLVPEKLDYLEWIQATSDEEIQFIAVETVGAFTAFNKLTLCCTPTKEYALRIPLKELELQLDPRRFWRVHRNAILRVGAIERVVRDPFKGLLAYLWGYAKPIPISRSAASRFRSM